MSFRVLFTCRAPALVRKQPENRPGTAAPLCYQLYLQKQAAGPTPLSKPSLCGVGTMTAFPHLKPSC